MALGKTLPDLLQLLRLAAIQSNRLGVLANTHKAEAKIGFAPQLVKIQVHEPVAENKNGDQRAGRGVKRQEIDEFP